MKFGDMTLRELTEWCVENECSDCPFHVVYCYGGVSPYELYREDVLETEVPGVNP